MKAIPLTQGKVAFVDDDMYEILSKYKWYARYSRGTQTFYPVRNFRLDGKQKTTDLLYWSIIGKPLKGFVIDHINGDTLDNRRANLRIVTSRENQANAKSHRSGKLVGATFQKSIKRWCAFIHVDKKTKYLGCFLTEIAAHNAYVQAKQSLLARVS